MPKTNEQNNSLTLVYKNGINETDQDSETLGFLTI
jgi:hypothetical protein